MRIKKTLIVWFIIFLVLLGAFIVFFVLKKNLLTNQQMYASPDCSIVESLLPDEELLQLGAITEYENFFKHETIERLNGVLECYCKKKKSEGFDIDTFKPEGYEEAICAQYSSDQFWGFAMAQVVTFLVVVINYVLRLLMITLIQYIGYKTETL